MLSWAQAHEGLVSQANGGLRVGLALLSSHRVALHVVDDEEGIITLWPYNMLLQRSRTPAVSRAQWLERRRSGSYWASAPLLCWAVCWVPTPSDWPGCSSLAETHAVETPDATNEFHQPRSAPRVICSNTWSRMGRSPLTQAASFVLAARPA